MALPALELHDPLHGLAVDSEALSAQSSPHHTIAEIGLGVDEVLDPLRQNFVDDRDAIVFAVVRRAAGDAERGRSRLVAIVLKQRAVERPLN